MRTFRMTALCAAMPALALLSLSACTIGPPAGAQQALRQMRARCDALHQRVMALVRQADAGTPGAADAAVRLIHTETACDAEVENFIDRVNEEEMGEVAGLEALGAGLQSAGANMQSAGAGWGATAAAVAANPPPSAPDIPLTPLHLYTPPPPPADYPSAGIGAAAAGALSPTGGWVSNPLNPPP